MYKVLESFADLQDHEHIYREGDVFPRPGYDVSDERLKELSTGRNKTGRPLVREFITEEVVAPRTDADEATVVSETITPTQDEPKAQNKPRRKSKKNAD